jgi:hypothetical protein
MTKDKMMTIKVTADELQSFKDNAKKNGFDSVGAFIRWLNAQFGSWMEKNINRE